MHLDKLSSVTRLGQPTTKNNSLRQLMRLVPVFILETNNQMNNKCLPKFIQTDNAFSTAIAIKSYRES